MARWKALILPFICLAVFLAITGCITGGLFGEEGPVPLTIANSANSTHTFEVWVTEGALNNKEVVIKKKGGEVDRASPGEGLSTYKLDGDYGYITLIELPPERSRLHGRYTLEPQESNQSSIERVKTGSTVVVIIYDGNRVVSLVTAYCGGDLAFFEVTMRYYGSASAYNCGGGL